MDKFTYVFVLLLLPLLVAAKPHPSFGAESEANALHLYLDADFGQTRRTAEAIKLGFETALGEVDWQIAGQPIKLLPQDHRGSPKRSRRTMEKFLNDPRGLAVIGGKQSPPYLSYGDFINEAGIPLLLTWAAAGPVTRQAEGPNNWIFRLSVDDSKAGPFLVKTAETSGCNHLALLLLDTGWGRANRKTMLEALRERGKQPVLLRMFDTQLGPYAARTIAHDVAATEADCVLLVGSATSGGHLVLALHDVKPSLRVLSHWGILGWEFAENVGHEIREAMGLRILQTCGLEVEIAGSPRLDKALSAVRLDGRNVSRLSEIPSSAGFVHGYDMARILISATRQASQTGAWQNGPAARRQALKQALEQLETPVEGILRTYIAPFAQWSPDNPDAHEALGVNDLCLAAFQRDGTLVSVTKPE